MLSRIQVYKCPPSMHYKQNTSLVFQQAKAGTEVEGNKGRGNLSVLTLTKV